MSAERSTFCLAVTEYAALRRRADAAPEHVLGSVKAIINALSTNTDPTTVDRLGRLVLDAFLAGYYGEAGRTRGPGSANPRANLR